MSNLLANVSKRMIDEGDVKGQESRPGEKNMDNKPKCPMKKPDAGPSGQKRISKKK